MAGGVGHTGGLTNPAPGAEDAEPVILIPVGLPCLERGRLSKKKSDSESWFVLPISRYIQESNS